MKKARIPALALAAVLLLSSIPAAAAQTGSEEATSAASAGSEVQRYTAYLASVPEQHDTGKSVTVSGTEYTAGSGVRSVSLPEDGGAALMTEEESSVTWSFSIPESGMYAFRIAYYPLEGNGTEIQRRASIDGSVTVAELENVTFRRVFRDSQPIERIEGGNDIRAGQEEVRRLLTADICDSSGYHPGALRFYLTAGEHTLTLEGIQEPLAVVSLTAYSETVQTVDYAQYLADVPTKTAAGIGGSGLLLYEAEEPAERSDAAIYGASDNTSPENSPYDYAAQKLNVIGGSKWQSVGQWISWEVNAPETGLYQIGFRFRQQNARQAVRKLTIDGAVPFTEAEMLVFPRSDAWQVMLAGGETPYSFYLEKGTHTLRLEVVLGAIREPLVEAAEILDRLNEVNWSLMTVLGTDPDTNRDYQLGSYMPQELQTLAECAVGLRAVAERFMELSDQKDAAVAELEQFAELLEDISSKPSKLPARYSYFRDSVSSFATLIENEKLQPLLLDRLFLAEPEATLPAVDSSLLVKFKYGFLRFLSSFVHDYSALSDTASADRTVRVWIGNGLSGGRDQALVLNRLIAQDFTPQSQIAVDLQLVPAGTVLTATLAGKGPDVALQLGSGDPVNYAMRNAVLPLSTLDGWEEVKARFAPEALVGFTYLDQVYAVPETMDFPVLFYRKDIMDSLGIRVEALETWDDLIEVLPTIQSGNMNFAIPTTYLSYYIFLMQNGGSLYDAAGTCSQLGQKAALDAFYRYMKLYMSYGMPYSYSLETRFRSGEIPLAVANYSVYNIIKISGPEIDGLWSMAPIPGIRQADGTVNRTAPVSCAGCVIMSAAKDPQACWQFLQWWTDAEVQYEYGRELESTLGTGARYNAANLEAIGRLPWNAQERRVLRSQMEALCGVPEVPGGYMTSRNVDFAIKAVYSTNSDPRDTLRSYIPAIDEEIRLKRKEFHLDE